MAGTGRVRTGMPPSDRSRTRGLPGSQHPGEVVPGQELPVLRPDHWAHCHGRGSAGAITPDKASVEWSDIPAERLQEVLSGAEPVCFACHMASKMMREHPELVIDRSQRTVPPSL